MTSSVPPLCFCDAPPGAAAPSPAASSGAAAGLSTMEKGGKGNGADQEEPESGPDQEKGGLLSLLQSENSETAPAPMDSNVLLSRPPRRPAGGSTPFTREKLFTAASQGDAAQLHGLLDFLQLHRKRLTSPEFKDESNGKTVLLKAFLNLKDGRNDTIEVLMDIAEKTLDSESFINAAYTDPSYKGQTALHVAIERRALHYVELLVQKGADVQAKASGTFFQRNAKLGFYFGELPLSLAACTNQPEVVSFLLENPHRRADPTDRDSQGNTVLHMLVEIADDSAENTETVAEMYDKILVLHHKLNSKVQLESMQNNEGLTPLKLAVKLGKIGLFRHMLNREFVAEETRQLSRKLTEWVYGPVHSSLYDMSDMDTDENNSVLEIIVFGSEIPNRPEMLQIEPLRSLLQDKWQRFASKLFLLNFLSYLLILAVFTTAAFYRKDGQPPFPVENVPADHLRCLGEIISVLGAARFLYKTITIFRRNPPNISSLFTDGFTEILFFLQAALLLLCAVLYCCGRTEYVGLLVLSLALAWMNVLYYTRGSRQLGIYNVMMQRMILGDLLHFLCVYIVLLFGFSAAVCTLIDDSPGGSPTNDSVPRQRSFNVETFKCEKPSYNDIGFTTLELFKFTIGMGDLEFTDHVQNQTVFYVLLICYIVLTYILMLNMLIALMGNTVERIKEQSQTIWNLQRAFTILDMERTLPRWLRTKLQSDASEMVCVRNDQDDARRFVRVTEINWKKWRSDVGVKLKEEPAGQLTTARTEEETSGNPWNVNVLLQRIRSRRQEDSYVL
ncbi:PREDICTED: LOW QUALITY PROTEIN: transient receptor potential cation channel subfamily V member 1-like [Poecilia mexicana]|uniref:LOW QUALITY PROTEIN: transient receptor potential cation channel subfamily V member 1-like n=1 Tax=Poecilia mexicana TaxID=48701 RepID=UPI00072ED880|nr:PREDICTED: LOW QUALITY PROTEIN: transient receptor potential cation channel subfamily V member 1-like [Poecilia mexicana]